MATPEEVQALEEALDQTATDLSASISEVQDELNAQQAQIDAGNQANLSNALAKVAALDESVKAVAALKPIEVTPPTE